MIYLKRRKGTHIILLCKYFFLQYFFFPKSKKCKKNKKKFVYHINVVSLYVFFNNLKAF